MTHTARGAVVGLRGAVVGVSGAAVGNIGIPTYVIYRGAVVRQPFFDLLESPACLGPAIAHILYAIDLVHPTTHSMGSVIIKSIITYRAPSTTRLPDLELISSIVHSPLILLGCVWVLLSMLTITTYHLWPSN